MFVYACNWRLAYTYTDFFCFLGTMLIVLCNRNISFVLLNAAFQWIFCRIVYYSYRIKYIYTSVLDAATLCIEIALIIIKKVKSNQHVAQ